MKDALFGGVNAAVLTAMNETYTKMWREHPWRD